MSEKANYFGKDSITPSFLRASAAQASLKNFESSASQPLSEAEKSDAKNAEQGFSYTGSGKPKDKHHLKNKLSKTSKLKKSLPALFILGLLFGAIFFMFSSISMLGNQLETLVTRATDTMFGSYSETTLTLTEELLAGRHGEFPSYLEKRLNNQGITVSGGGEGYSLEYQGETITSDNLREVYQDNIAFREAFTKAKRGRTSNFFDAGATLTYSKLLLSRNLFSSYKQTGDDAADDAAYRKIESSVFEGGADAKINTVNEQPVLDDSGQPVLNDAGEPVIEKVPSGEVAASRTTSGDAPKVKAQNYLLNISGRVANAGGIACAALQAGNLLSVAIATYSIYQAIHLFLSNQQNISKTISGDGDTAAANSFLNFISELFTTTYIDADTGEEVEVSGSALEGEGLSTALAGEKANTSKTRNYAVGAAFITTSSALGLTAYNSKLCGGIRASGAVISLLGFVAGGALFSSIITLAKSFVINAAIQATVSSMLGALIPRIAQSLFSNSFESLEGIPFGETFMLGADELNKSSARKASGQMYASEEVATAYNHYTIAAAKSEAEMDRASKSPFDASSPNTFIGSFVGKFATLAGSTSLLSGLSSLSSLVHSSTASITGTALSSVSAADFSDLPLTYDSTLSGTDFQSIYADPEDCAKLSEIGAACTMYGSGITATDPKVIGLDMDDEKYQAVLAENVYLNDEGFYEVIEGSLLSKKIKYIDNRDSPLGILDANIVNDFATTLGALDAAPVLGDVVDIVNAIETSSDEAINWGLGVYGVLNPETNPYYEDMIYLQHFQERQRISSQMQLSDVVDEDGNDHNASLAYIEDYYSKNPIDTSEAGLIAHFTGFTTDDVELTAAYLAYIAYLEDYEIPEFVELSDFAQDRFAATPPTAPTLLSFIGDIKRLVEYDTIKDKVYVV